MKPERLQEIKEDIANWFNLSENCHVVLEELITALEDRMEEQLATQDKLDEAESQFASMIDIQCDLTQQLADTQAEAQRELKAWKTEALESMGKHEETAGQLAKAQAEVERLADV